MKCLKTTISLSILFFSGNLFSQDIIMLKNGEEVKSKVTEVNSSEVKYKKHSNLEGPTYSANKSDIFMIKYENGEKEVYGAINTKSDLVTHKLDTPTHQTNSTSKLNEDKFLRISGFRIYEGNTKISGKEFEAKMRTNPLAYGDYQTARYLNISSSLISSIGLIYSVIPMLNEEITPQEKKTANIVSWSSIAVGLGIGFLGNSKMQKAIATYNSSQKAVTRLSVNKNGVGLALHF
ncbi:MAG: hypothetical protein JNL70_13660 [Saprospiraceae bacterium]|nr:hypothetical protein [Saprospiraceae bacterium]